MLSSHPTRKGTGIRITGSASELELLYNVIHRIADSLNETVTYQSGQKKLLMNFAYEVRKAFMGARDKETTEEGASLYGFKLLWPDIILFTAALRYVAGFFQTDKLIQSQLYLIEYLIEDAMLSYDPQGAHLIKELVIGRIPTQAPLIFQAYQKIHLTFVEQRTGKKRFRNLPLLIRNYVYERSTKYEEMKTALETYALQNNCDLDDIEFADDYEISW